MHGNTEEWCDDAWHKDYQGAPDDGSAWLERPDLPASMVVRGGWCGGLAALCRSARRGLRRADTVYEGTKPDKVDSNPANGFADDEIVAVLNSTSDRPYYSKVPAGLRIVCEIR
jgi:hypothetical protein